MEKDIIVVGCGPAGLAAAQYSARAGYSVLGLDPMGPGGQLLFIDEIENYPGREKVSGYELSADMEKQCQEFGAELDYACVSSIRKEDRYFIVESDIGSIKAKAVILATGATHRHLGVEGEEEYTGKGVSYCATCDGAFFKGRDVVVAGGGDTALTDALYLAKLCRSVTIIHRRSTFRAQKVLVSRVMANEKIRCVMENNITGIKGDGESVKSITLSDGSSMDTDGVFIFIGTEPVSSLVEGLCERDGGFIVANDRMETSLPGLFAAGDVRTTSFRQVVTAASDGARAAHSADEYIQMNFGA